LRLLRAGLHQPGRPLRRRNEFWRTEMGAIKTAFDNIGNGIKHAFEAVGEIAVGALTLDFKGIAKGMGDMVGAGGDMVRGALNLTPAALAANTLLDGAIDKALKQAGKLSDSMVRGALDTIGNDLDMVKNGAGDTLHGMMTGNVSEMGRGLFSTTIGAVSAVEDITPEGMAMNGGISGIRTLAAGNTPVPRA